MSYLSQMVDLFIRGGIFMWPLLAVAVVAIVLILERLLYLRENRIDWDRFHFELKSALKENNLERAVVLAAKTKGVIGRVIEECLLKIQSGETDIESATEKIILDEMSSMEKSRGWLATVIQISPLLGIIGTVQGMILCFMTIESSATTDPKLLAGGIYTALITTFAGLVITIPAAIAQEYFRKEINKILHFMDLYLIEVREWQDKRSDGGKTQNKEAGHAHQHA